MPMYNSVDDVLNEMSREDLARFYSVTKMFFPEVVALAEAETAKIMIKAMLYVKAKKKEATSCTPLS